MKFRSLTEAIDTETPAGRAMWQLIGVLAELELSLIVERTKAGVIAARAPRRENAAGSGSSTQLSLRMPES